MAQALSGPHFSAPELFLDGAGAGFIGPKRAAGAAEFGWVVDDLLAVVMHRAVAVRQRDVDGSPLSQSLENTLAFLWARVHPEPVNRINIVRP